MNAGRAALLFAGRDLRIARSYRFPFLMTIAGTVMSLITFRFIAELVGDAAAVRETGDYFAFVVVGMVVAQVLDRTISGPSAAVRQEQVQGTLEVLTTQPVSPATLASGWTAYPLLEGMVTAIAMLLIAFPLGLRLQGPDVLAAIPALFLSAVTFAAIGVLAAAFVVVFQQAGQLTRWLSAMMALISGVFFPVSLFPGWVQGLATLSPMTHALRALRASLLQGRGITAIGDELLALLAAALILVPLAIGALTLALDRARRKGTLSSY